MAFKVRSEILDTTLEILRISKGNKVMLDYGLLCKYCSAETIISQSHCLQCSAWDEQRTGLDIKDTVKFFRWLLDERANIDKKNVLQKTASHNSCN